MGMTWEKGVHGYGMNQYFKNKEFVGEADSRGRKTPHFYVGHYSFSNPYSANMFSYLFNTYDGAVAKSVVEKFEKKLSQNAARAFYDLVEFDWGSFVKGNLRGTLDVQGTITNIVVRIAGWAYHQVRMQGALAEWNPNSPSDLGDDDGYVFYAIAYWGGHPKEGPAYRVLQK